MKLEGIKEEKTYRIDNMDKLAEGLAKDYDISHKQYDGLGCSNFKIKYCYEFAEKGTGRLKGSLEYVISKRDGYWCSFELEGEIIRLRLPEYNEYGLPDALGRHSKCRNKEQFEKDKKERLEMERRNREADEIDSINRAVSRYYETGDSHDFIGE